jgi:hypothetical protein
MIRYTWRARFFALLLPTRGIAVGEHDLSHHTVVHDLTEFVLATDVPVERRGSGAEFFAQSAHGQDVRTVGVGDLHRDDRVAGEWLAPASACLCGAPPRRLDGQRGDIGPDRRLLP